MNEKVCYLYERGWTGERKLFNSKDKAILHALNDYLKDIKAAYLSDPDQFEDDKISIEVFYDVCDILEWGNCLRGDDYIQVGAITIPEEGDD